MYRLWMSAICLALTLSTPVIAVEGPSAPRAVALLESGKRPVRIVCFGDSVTGVYYHSGGRRAWPDMLGIALKSSYPKAKLDIHNAGISGNATGDALARIDKDVLARRPDLVVVMFGLNDICAGNREVFRANLKAIANRCRNAGAAVVLCTLNSVCPNAARPMPVVAEFSRIVRDVAAEMSVPVADCFQAYENLHRKDATAWLVMFSENNHPCMLGHKLFAETVAETVSGRHVSLADVPPPNDAMRFTTVRLKAGQPIKMIAMPPYDRMAREALVELFPKANISVTPWPIAGQSLTAMEEWAKRIRDLKPDLVVVAVPANAAAKDTDAFIRSYHWVLSWSIAYERAQWDVLPILPGVAGAVPTGNTERVELARRIIAGRDLACLARLPGDRRPAKEILVQWLRDQMHAAEPTPKNAAPNANTTTLSTISQDGVLSNREPRK